MDHDQQTDHQEHQAVEDALREEQEAELRPRKWDPLREPFRVVRIRRGGPHGWSSTHSTFATIEEAEADRDAPMRGGVYEVHVDRVRMKDGRAVAWDRLSVRKTRQKAKTLRPKTRGSR